MEQCDQLLSCWRLWHQGIKSVPWKTTACKWDLCSAQHLYFSSHCLNFFTVCLRGRADSQGEKPCIMWYLYLALSMTALVCQHPLFFHVLSVYPKIWVSWVFLGVTEGRRKLGKGGMADMTRGGGQHHWGVLPLRQVQLDSWMLLWSCQILLAWCFCSHLQAQQALVLSGTWPGWLWPGELMSLAMGYSPENRKKRWCNWFGGKIKGKFCLQDLGGECKYTPNSAPQLQQ